MDVNDTCEACGAHPGQAHDDECPVYLAALRRDVAHEKSLAYPKWKRRVYGWRFTNWLMACPWRIYPIWMTGWRYHSIASSMRHGFKFPFWIWHTITFPHVHAPWED